jgi:hypothetical protein
MAQLGGLGLFSVLRGSALGVLHFCKPVHGLLEAAFSFIFFGHYFLC